MLARASVVGASFRIVASRAIHGPACTSNLRSFRFFSAEPVDDTSEATTQKPTADEKKPVKSTKKSVEELPVQYADISRAHVAIRDGVVRTECKRSHFISELVGANVYLKSEQRQFTGSFKERGARNALLQLIQTRGDEFKKTGAIAASAGNHALALAYHGKLLDVPVTVVMPTVAPLAKVDKCRVRPNRTSVFLHVAFLSHSFSSFSCYTEIRCTNHYSRSSYRRSQGVCRDSCRKGESHVH